MTINIRVFKATKTFIDQYPNAKNEELPEEIEPYLRAFLNDPELVEKVAIALANLSTEGHWQLNELPKVHQGILLEEAKVAVQAIKQEAGIV